ncbi:MAG TPA: LD-carboxypeptidase [Methylomirabilota bacterium]|nr:LD-carboxypeptidase [Methylomirabilota bacterium]
MPVIKPPRLTPGDLIGIVAPASPPASEDKVHAAVRYFEQRGFRVKLGPHIFARRGYLAGEDMERADDLNSMFADREVKAVFALRGGYGSPRLLELIDFKSIAAHPKIFVGFSDITALQLAVFKKTGLITFSGPMPAVEFCGKPDPFTETAFWSLVTDPSKGAPLNNPGEAPLQRWGKGSCVGRLLGGNLALVTSLLGTPFCPSFKKAVLVLEEVGEYPYRVDRMLFHLKNAQLFKDAAGILLGHFSGCDAKDKSAPQLTLDQILSDVFGPCAKPILSNLQYGHIERKLTLPIGARVRVDADARAITLLESPVT